MIKNLTLRPQLFLANIVPKHNPLQSSSIKYSDLYFNKSFSHPFNFSKYTPITSLISYQFSTFNKKPQNSQSKQTIHKKPSSNRQTEQRQPLKMRPSRKQQKKAEYEKQKSFVLSVTDPELFIDHINNKNSIQDAVKLMNRILNNKSLTKEQFEEKVWKKYSYYVFLVGQNILKDFSSKQAAQKQSQNHQHSTQMQSPKIQIQEKNPGNSKTSENQIFNNRVDNHEISRKLKTKKLSIEFLSQITEIQTRFKGQLTSQNVTKTFNKFTDYFFQRHQWSGLNFSQRLSLLQSVSRYNLKKAKTLFLKKRDQLFSEVSNRNSSDQKQIYEPEDLIKLVDLIVKLEINDTALFQTCIDLLYDHVHLMKLDKLQNLAYLLGKTHKFINKDLVTKIKQRFNQLINEFNDTEVIQSLHIISALSLIEKNMQLKSVYFEPLDIVYERVFPIFNFKLLSRLKSKYLVQVASALRRSQFFHESILTSLIDESIMREVLEFSQSEKDSFANSSPLSRANNRFEKEEKPQDVITIPQLTQIFFCLANFNFRDPKFMKYFVNLLTVVQESKDPQNFISYPLFSRLLWSICVLCNDQEIQKLLPLLQHFYKKSKTIQPHEATNFYYCYLLLKRKYLVGEIRFQNDKIQQYILGPKHEIQISETQKEIHKGLLELGIPSLIEYNLNNVICDIYIPKYNDIEHLIIEVHGFHHFCRNVKRRNGSTVLKEKIIENEGYECFYISLDEWLIAEDKKEFLKGFFETIVSKKHEEKMRRKRLEASVKEVEKVERRGRRVLEFRKTRKESNQQIGEDVSQRKLLENRD